MNEEIKPIIEEVAEYQELEKKQEETEEVVAITVPKKQTGITMWNDMDKFGNAQRIAKLLAQSQIVPQAYQGNIADCVIAVDMANRMGVSPIVVMQNSQIVKGNFSWKGTACKSMIDACGLYKKTRYVEVGERGTDSWGYYLEAVDKESGEVIKGVTVTIKMAKKEGWYDKNGSKWQTMPELMLKYRASAFFMRTECAGLAMGFLTTEENEDIEDLPAQNNKRIAPITNLLEEEN